MIRTGKCTKQKVVTLNSAKRSLQYKYFRDKDINVFKNRWYDHFYLLIPAAALIRMALTIFMITQLATEDHDGQSKKNNLIFWELKTCICCAENHQTAHSASVK